eukprot:symbB.v1.2.005363.t1/scaffold301.1/size235092/15
MGKGLPWSSWLGLNNTQEKVVALSSGGSTGSGCGVSFMRCSVQVRNSTAFMILSDEPPPYRVENWSDSRTLALRFRGDDYCEILPPLSWFAFDWPTRAQYNQKERVLILQDLHTENKEMYQAHELGLGLPLKLDATVKMVTGATAELTEDGFKEVLLKEDQEDTRRFVQRVAQDLSSSTSSDMPSIALETLDLGAITSREMRQQMIEKGLVEPEKPEASGLTKRGHERAMLCPYTMTAFVKFLLHCGGLSTSDDHIKIYVSSFRRLPNLLQLLEKLPEEKWVRKDKAPEDAFQALLKWGRDVEHTGNVMHMLIRRHLEDLAAMHPKLAASLMPKSTDVQDLGKTLAEELREGRWPSTVAPWTHFTTKVASHYLPEERRSSTADSAQVSDEDAADEEEFVDRPNRLQSSKSDGVLDEMGKEMMGKTEPLSQDGFEVIQALNSTAAMAAFVKRILLEERGDVKQNDQGSFDDFVESCVGDMKLTFSGLQQEILQGPSWALFLKKPGKLYVNRCFDGVSRVFSVRDHLMVQGNDKGSSAHFECWDIDVQLAGAQICVVFQAQATSLGCGHVNAVDEEIVAVTVDHLQLRKKAAERKVKFVLHHFQIDNMREADRSRPIIICPEDSGYYSDRRENLKHRKNQEEQETVPFLYFCIEDVPSGILHFKELELLLQPVIMRLDMEFWIEIGQQLLAWISTANSNAAAAVQGLSAEDRQIMENQIRNLREGGIDVPSGKTTHRPIYLEKFRLGALIAQVEFLMPMKKTTKILKQSKASSGSDSATTLEDAEDQFDTQWLQSMWLSRKLARLTYRSHGLMKTVLTFAQKLLVFVITSVGSGVLSSIGHVTPRFALPETVIRTELADLTPFAMGLFRNYCKHGMWESYKVLGSMNILGDPIGWTLSVGGAAISESVKEAWQSTPTIPMPILCFHPFISAFLSIHAMSNLEIILTWKDKGNAKLKEEDKEGAIECYSRGLEIGWKAIDQFQGIAEDFEPLKTAVSQISANRAHLRLLLDEPELALEDCTMALEVDFQNTKAYWRGTIAALRLGFEHPRRQEASELLRQGLRMAYDGGTALPQLLKEHLETFKLWADQGHLPSIYLVALAFLRGNGVPKDNDKALAMFQEASAKGDDLSKAMVEQLKAHKSAKLPPELDAWAREAASGDTTAQFNLGLAYYRGDLVQQDLVKCEQLWERAAEQGDDMARENLATLREHLKLAQRGGVKQFFLKTGSEVMAGDLKGEGLRNLAQGVVGGTAAHVGKFFGALGDTVDALAQTGDSVGQNYLPGSVNHVGDGVIVGTQVFGRHVVSGVTGLVQAPIHGFRSKGWRGLGEGFLKGVRGAVAQPVSGLMHGAQHIADGVDATTRLWDHWGQISVRRSARVLQSSQLQPLTGAEFSPRITVWVDALEFLTHEGYMASEAANLGQLRGATYRVHLNAGDWTKACKLGHLARNGAIQFDQAKWVPIQTLLESDLQITVQDCTLPGHLDYDMKMAYQATLDRTFILQQVAKVLQEPEDLAMVDDCVCRWRPSRSCRVRLERIGQQPRAELLLRFWPAWDPVRVPNTQQWVPKRPVSMDPNTGSSRIRPERKEGMLLKKSKGALLLMSRDPLPSMIFPPGLLHHWSEKWVVLENHEFRYWSDRKDYEQQELPEKVGEIKSLETWDKDLGRIRGRRKLEFALVRDRNGDSLPLWVARITRFRPSQFPLAVLAQKATFKVCYRLADPKCQCLSSALAGLTSYFKKKSPR